MKTTSRHFILSLIFIHTTAKALPIDSHTTSSPYTSLTSTTEEQRISTYLSYHPNALWPYSHLISKFKAGLSNKDHYASLEAHISTTALSLWRIASTNTNTKDDRPLYWARLTISKLLREHLTNINFSRQEREELFWQLELKSRGQADIHFKNDGRFKVLITGFDPFFLDKNINQSNPSGSIVQSLDGKTLSSSDKTAQIEAVILPVRFEDFDRGMVETVLEPYLRSHSVDMIVTISMGRSNFDLERFPGLRRSSLAPDNLDIYTGASSTNPKIPFLKEKHLDGPEFVEYSLPANAMQKATGPYKININNRVVTLAGTQYPNSLSELDQSTSIAGSGGGYLSNEVSYRSIRLRNHYQSLIPVGHIHTPKVNHFSFSTQRTISDQVERMLKQVLTTL